MILTYAFKVGQKYLVTVLNAIQKKKYLPYSRELLEGGQCFGNWQYFPVVHYLQLALCYESFIHTYIFQNVD